MFELVIASLIVLTVAGSGVAVLPWTEGELRSSVRAWGTVRALGGLLRSAARELAVDGARRAFALHRPQRRPVIAG
jgi:hypothetical protein